MDEVIDRARAMRVAFLEDSNFGSLPVAINTVKFGRTVERVTGYSIESRGVDSLGVLRGLIARLAGPEKRALVLISESKNTDCWKRFTFVKEISHLFLEGVSDFNADAYQQAQCLVDAGITNEVLFKKEVNGIRAAMEIMIPDELYEYIAHKANVDEMTPYSIAFLLKVPQKFMEFRLRQWDLPIN